MPARRNKLPRYERLHLKKEIDRIFQQGQRAFAFPYKVTFFFESSTSHPGLAMMVIVPKRLFKRATQRNYQKRRIREAYRLQAHSLRQVAKERNIHVAMAFQIVSNEEVAHPKAYKSIATLLQKIEKIALTHA